MRIKSNMALYRTLRNLKMLHLCRCHAEFCLPGLTQVRHAWYKPTYVDPIVDKEEYKDGKLPVDISVPVKAAPSFMSSTFMYDPLVSKFVNVMMKGGKKEVSQQIMAETFTLIKMKQLERYHKAPESERENIETNAIKIFHQALENAKPILGLSTIKRGGRAYQAPTPLTPQRQRFLAMSWILAECNRRPVKTKMPIRLSRELLDAYDNRGKAVERKQNLHKMCEANKAFAHLPMN
ncbi:small ribosomal subunit protein uS7m-like [Amphiura filiformis]|uniref:small ribosomal subunit protein uS7m-like n=1 Tax=Amphiura filiformis TaxID=82378 RepID=UPI003B2202A7